MADNFDNYGMKVQATASVKMPTASEIDKQIRNLEKSISKLQISGKLDDSSLKNLSHQLDTLKATVTTANFSPTALTELTNQVNRALQNINIGNINVGNVGNQAQQVGQQIGQQINQGVSQSLSGNTGVLDTFRRSLENIGMGSEEIDAVANRIENLGVKIEALNQSTSHTVGRRGNRDILSVDISGIDQLGQAVKLTQQYDVASGELIRSVDAVSTATQKANTQLENLTAQQITRQQNLRNQISQIYESAISPNASRSITDDAHLMELRRQYNAIQTAINEMGSTSKTVFAEQEANVTGLITTLKNTVSEYKNAENVSTSLKPDKLAEGISKAQSRWKALDADIKNAGVSSEKLTQQTQLITEMLGRIDGGGVLNKAEVEQVHTALTNAKNELTALVKIDTSNSSLEAIRLQADTLKNKLDEFAKKNTGFADWTREVNNTIVNVETLKTELDNVRTASDLRVATARVNEFESAFKAVNATVKSSTKEQDAYEVAYKELKKLYDLKIEYAKLGSNKETDFYYGKAIADQEKVWRQAWSKTSEPDNWNVQKRNELHREELVLQDKLAQAYGKTANARKQAEDVNKIQLLSNGGIKNDYATQIAKLEGDFRSLGLAQDTINTKTQNVKNSLATLKTEFAKPVDQQNFQAIQTANDNLQRELIESRNEYERLKASMKGMVTEQQRLSLANTIEAWNQKNTAATREVVDENHRYIMSLRDLNTQMTKMDFGKISTGFKQNENSMRAMNRLGKSLKEQFTQAYQSFTMWLSASSLVMKVISETREAFTELRNINTLLTEISKANENLTKEQLSQIGNNSFDIASKYGKSASDFLKGVQEASRAGYKNAEAMAELSTAAQGAGDMTSDVANQFIIATDKAYKLNGSVTELTKVLDGVNYITNHNAVNMTELSEAMTIVGSTAASFGVETNELTAALGTMAATTQQSGSEVARAFRAILLNIRQVSDNWLLPSNQFAPYVQKCA